MTRELAGKTAVVTGATSDTGRAIALALVEAGATVHALGRRPERLEELVALAAEVVPHAVDLHDGPALERMLAGIGRVDVLVLNAAHPPELAPFLKSGMDQLRAIMETNFFAASRLILGVLPGMLEGRWGRIIAISSLAASIGEAHGPSYCASKAALDGMLRNLAIDYSPSGVTCNSIEAGPVATERFANYGPTKARRFAMAAAVRRVGEPRDVAHAVRFLASPLASYVTGECLRVDGGLHLGNPLAAMYVREASEPRESV